MALNEYFDFLAADDIRIKGHRIGIETVLYEYLYRERTAEEIQQLYPSLTLAEVYTTILYYLLNQESVSRYIQDWLEWSHQQRKLQAANPHPAAERLRKLKAERERQTAMNSSPAIANDAKAAKTLTSTILRGCAAVWTSAATKSKLKKRLTAMIAVATAIGVGITGVTEFANTAIDVGNKLGIEIQLPPAR
ncbi:MAG: DUF433 domain-containing protein [Microcoleus sp.]